VHSLIDKVYQPENLKIAWERVEANQGAGGVDGQSTKAFGERLDEQLDRLHEELRTNRYQPRPVRQTRIPKQGKPIGSAWYVRITGNGTNWTFGRPSFSPAHGRRVSRNLNF